ncbi:MAG: DUF2784 family protein [Sphingobacteriales bacterium]|nr:MAG: DUF2784 family protein [Sphingobacteriales bacterium]
MLLHLPDWFFLIFHTVVILFNLFGWIWRKTRKANLILLLLTAFSWFVLGIWYGWGYCICTDWHWQILQKTGENNLPDSYITYLLMRLFPDLHVPQVIIDSATAGLFFLALLISVVLNIREWKINKNRKADAAI